MKSSPDILESTVDNWRIHDQEEAGTWGTWLENTEGGQPDEEKKYCYDKIYERI